MSGPSPWRPRLVEEGTPLYGDVNDHSMDEAERAASSHSQNPLHYRDAYQHVPSRHAHETPLQGTSLSRAAGGPIRSRPARISTRLTIDNDEINAATHDDHHDAMAWTPPSPRKASPLKMRLVVGGEAEPNHHVQQSHHHHHHSSSWDAHHHHVERMEGVEHHGVKGPLVVMDGANIAYAYADAIAGYQGSHEPDSRGIRVAANYFLSVDVRVLVVIPAPWFRNKPRAGDSAHGTCR